MITAPNIIVTISGVNDPRKIDSPARNKTMLTYAGFLVILKIPEAINTSESVNDLVVIPFFLSSRPANRIGAALNKIISEPIKVYGLLKNKMIGKLKCDMNISMIEPR